MPQVLKRIEDMAPYVPGRSVAEIRERLGLSQVIKLASNENPIGASQLAQEAVRRNAGLIFRYPQGGNPELVKAIARKHGVEEARVVAGNGSDEIIDLLMRIMAEPGRDNIACFEPCFGMYTTQAAVNGIDLVRQPLRPDFSLDLSGLAQKTNSDTKLVFVTTPDNPSGYCPPRRAVQEFAAEVGQRAPKALVMIDEAYMDFSSAENELSLLRAKEIPANVGFLRTFSKSMGLAGIRVGYAILPRRIAGGFKRARMPFSVNVLAEAAALAALEDEPFYAATLEAVEQGRKYLEKELTHLGCKVWPSQANFLMFRLPENSLGAPECFEKLLEMGIIIRPLASYGLPENLRVSVGNMRENRAFISALAALLGKSTNA